MIDFHMGPHMFLHFRHCKNPWHWVRPQNYPAKSIFFFKDLGTSEGSSVGAGDNPDAEEATAVQRLGGTLFPFMALVKGFVPSHFDSLPAKKLTFIFGWPSHSACSTLV